MEPVEQVQTKTEPVVEITKDKLGNTLTYTSHLNGRLHGEQIKMHAGTKYVAYCNVYNNGRLVGPTVYYWKNGNKQRETTYVGEQPETIKEWYSNGKVKRFTNGVVDVMKTRDGRMVDKSGKLIRNAKGAYLDSDGNRVSHKEGKLRLKV